MICVLFNSLHWRVCNVWDWLKIQTMPKYGGWNSPADAYGGDEAEGD
jgi:DNA sulfur modification protein DndC